MFESLKNKTIIIKKIAIILNAILSFTTDGYMSKYNAIGYTIYIKQKEYRV